MQAEFDALLRNKTWILYPRPASKKVVKNKWALKIEKRSDCSIDKYKARLVAKGFDKENDSDFHKTFSPVIKPTIIRIVLALVVHHSCLFTN